MSMTAAAVKAAAMILSDERGRKAVGWIVVAALSPLIVLIAVLCSLGSDSAEHNNAAIQACFYGTALSAGAPAEYQAHITEMRSAFSLLSSAVSTVNAQAEGSTVDLARVEAVFYALCFGEDAPSRRAAANFVGSFYTTETRTRTVEVEDEETGETRTEEEEYTVTVPLPLTDAYATARSSRRAAQAVAWYARNSRRGTSPTGCRCRTSATIERRRKSMKVKISVEIDAEKLRTLEMTLEKEKRACSDIISEKRVGENYCKPLLNGMAPRIQHASMRL